MVAVIYILMGLVFLLILGLCLLVFRFNKLENEVTDMRFIKVEKKADDSYSLTTKDGKTIFDL